MNSKSASATVVASVLVVILAVAVSTTESANIVEEFSGEWYVAYFNNYEIDPDTECYREKYVIDPSTGTLTITSKTYKVSESGDPEIIVNTYLKVNDDPKTNTEWKRKEDGVTLKLQKITKEFAVYTNKFDKKVYMFVLTKNAVLTEKQLAEAKKIAKKVGFTGDELNRKYNTHCDKLPPL